MRTLMEIVGVIVWCFAVYVCSYDWEGLWEEENGSKFPGNLGEDNSHTESRNL